jgi:exodeoxyribonuclease V gamma subunit
LLHIHRAERADRLVDALAAILGEPPADPFTPETIAVPTRGMERWLTQRISARLGASPGRADGICANVEFPFPGRLIGGAISTASGIEPDDDPWPPERSVWPLLDVVRGCLGEPWLERLATHLGWTEADSGAGRRFGRLRLIADLFDQYGIRRPAMLQAWARGEDTDGSGGRLPDGALWQAELWRRLRGAIGVPSPAERLGDACVRLRQAPELVTLPDRISLFGLTRLPASYLEALSALAVGRDVHLFLLHPSPELWRAIADRDPGTPIVTRAQDTTEDQAANRLLASWGVDARELQLVMESTGEHADHHHELADPPSETLLGRLQADVRANRAPPGPPLPGASDERLRLSPQDGSVEIHPCHGPARQVEVLREVILHLLADDPTLEPRDVIVMCPDIETFAPLIEATFGGIELPDGEQLPIPGGDVRRIDLRVRLADRSLRQTNPVLGVVAQLLDLAEQRLTSSQMLDLAGSEPVRRRFRFDDDELARIRDWIVDSGIRWGLDSAHRAEYQLDKVSAGTWRSGLRRVLLGVAMAESGAELYERVLPVDDVESGAIDLAGRFAEFVDRVGTALDDLRGTRTVEGWTQAIGYAAESLTATSDRDSWQSNELQAMLAAIVAESGDAADRIMIGLSEARALLRHRLAGRPTRANFRTGHLTVCTLVPMRSVPHRVVCLLGLDDGAFPRKSPRDGDDLLLESPHVGDRDPRAEDRQMLLDALLAAGDRLILLYSGNDERTNARRPPAVPVGELLDAVDRTARVEDALASERIVIGHPLQPFDQRNFAPGRIAGDDAWSFDRTSLEGAIALSGPRRERERFLAAPLPSLPSARLTLDELVAFAERPVRAFMRQRLGIAGGGYDDEVQDGLPVELDGLERWQVGQRLLDGVLAGIAPDTVCRAEIARGALPPGQLGMPVIRKLWPDVELLSSCATSISGAAPRSIGINAALQDATILTGSVSGVRGNVLLTVSFSRLNARHRIAAWVRLLVLTAAHPDEPFEAVTIGKAAFRSDFSVAIARIAPLGTDPETRRSRATEELGKLVDLRARGVRDVLPVPPLAAAAYAGAAALGASGESSAREEWASKFNRPGEDADPDHVLAFGGVQPFEWLLETIPQSDEQGDGWYHGEEHSRFGRCARRLWAGLLDAEDLGER